MEMNRAGYEEMVRYFGAAKMVALMPNLARELANPPRAEDLDDCDDNARRKAS